MRKSQSADFEIIPYDRDLRFGQADFVELLDSTAERFGKFMAFKYLYDNGEQLEFKYSDVMEQVLSTVRTLESYGIVAGDRVVMIAPPSPFYIIVAMALPYMGATSVLIDYSLPMEEIERLLALSDPVAVVSTRKHFSEIRDTVTAGMVMFVIDENKTTLTHVNKSPAKVIENTADKDTDVMLILFSSGTTGEMKGVEITYHSIMRAMEIDSKIVGLDGIPGRITYFYVLPLNHIAGYVSAFVAFFWGAELDFLENVSPLRYLEGLHHFEPTHFLTVPAVFDIMEQKTFEKIRQKSRFIYWIFKTAFRFSAFFRKKTGIRLGKKVFHGIYSQFLGENIKSIITGASPCKDSTAKFFAAMGLEWVNFYATTETNIPIVAIAASDRVKYGYTGTVGSVEGVNVRIQDIDTEGIGEIQVKTDLIMKGYFRNPEATAAAFDDGWFRTGDRGYIDEKNRLHIVGRIKESIVLRSGKKVSAQDVDNYYLKALENKYNLACCGIPTDDGCEEIHIFIQDDGYTDHGKAEIKKMIMDTSAVSPSMYHVAEVHFIESIPKTSVGKIRRFMLRDGLKMHDVKMMEQPRVDDDTSEDGLCAIIKKYKPDMEVTFDSRLIEDLGMDSITLFNVKCDLESRYNLDFGGRFGTARTVGDLWNLMHGERPDMEESTATEDLSKYPSPRNERTGRVLARWTKAMSIPYRFEVSGLENIPQDGSNYIICANHASFLDPFWILNAAKGRIDYSRVAGLAAKERLDNRLERWLFDMFGAIPVDRYGNTLPATQRARECITDDKYIMFIFPEGARSVDGSMLPFKAGAAELSMITGRKILPVRMDGSFEIFPRHKKYPKVFRLGRRRKLRIVFGEPMDPKDYSNPTEMTQRMKEKISGL
ncbi:MAG: AMP-binding protein [Candidatus Methanomethylophilaceae archaeon]|nr:AMP-binding protein [Candidatus Methanomethylophilaceae archaeon]